MPWRTDSLMAQRLDFIEAVLHRRPGESIREVCRRVGISERTGHKWLKRFGAGGPAALADRSHAPHQVPHQVPRELADAICALREQQPTWGGRKLREVLEGEQPSVCWPAPSTITLLLTRAGLLPRRRRSLRERSAWARGALTPATAPNEVWGADFKGEFQLRDGTWCYPLTLSDLHSRYVLRVTALPSTAGEQATLAVRACFAEYGLPRVIRTDNGVPFGVPNALGGLSPLAVWRIRRGIRGIPGGARRPSHSFVVVAVVGVHDREGDRRTFGHVARLDPALRGVHTDRAALIVEPDRRHLRRTVRHDRRQAGKGLLLRQQVEK